MKKIIIIFYLFVLSANAQNIEHVYRAKIPLTAAQIKTASSAPVQMIASPGPGKAIEIINADIEFIFGTASFNMVDGGCGLITNTAQSYQFFAGQVLINSFSAITRMTDETGDISQLVYNQPVYFRSVFDASLGDGTANIYIAYRVLNDNPPPPPILDTTVTLTSTQILALFTTPVTVIPSPGASKTIQVVEATATVNFNTTAYVGGGNLRLITNTANFPQFHCSAFTASGNTKRLFIAQQATSAGDTQIIANQGLLAKASSGDPTTGNSTITIRIFYRILDY